MGADLYINSIYEPNVAKYRELYHAAAARRNEAEDAKDSEAAAEAQRDVEKFYGLMFSEGYFRDSYNSSSLLWVLGLSWWNDVTPMLNEEGCLEREKIQKLLDMVKTRPITEDAVRQAMAKISGAEEDELLAHFIRRKSELVLFLLKAIELNEPIYCSL